MIFCYYFSLFLFLIQPIYGFYHFIFEFDQYFGKEGNFFIFRERKFKVFKDMAKAILNEFKAYQKSFLLVHLNKVNYGGEIISYDNDGIYSILKREEYFPNFQIPNDVIPIKVFFKGSKVYYICDQSTFTSLKLAKEHVDDFKRYVNVKNQQSHFKIDAIYTNAWNQVWSQCHYQCFARQDYYFLKRNFLKELNSYRQLLMLPKLKCGYTLRQFAERRYALKNGLGRNEASKINKFQFKELTDFVDPPYASTQLSKWFSQRMNKDNIKKKNKGFEKTLNFLNLLFSKSITEACFGAVKDLNKIMVICAVK